MNQLSCAILLSKLNLGDTGVKNAGNINTGFMLKMNLLLFAIFIVVMIIGLRRAKLKDTGRLNVVKKQNINNRYVFYLHNLLTRKRFRRIIMKFSTMATYDFERIKEESVKLFERSVFVALVMPLLALLLFQNFMLMVLVAFVGYVYYNLTVDKEIDKLYARFVEELAYTIQSIHDCYTLSESVPLAVLNCERHAILERPIAKLYDILMDTDGDVQLAMMKKATPVRLLGTLASVCYISNNEGDVRGDNGESAFASELIGLRLEADKEVRRLLQVKHAFKSLGKLALAGLIVSPIADMFLLTRMPGTALYIKGMYGAWEKTLIIGVTILAYYLISVMTKPSVVNQVDKIEWIENLSKDRRIKEIVTKLIPKKFKTRSKLKMMLKNSISSKTEDYIYTSKLVFSAIGSALMLLAIVVFIVTARGNLSSNYGSLTVIPDNTAKTERDMIKLKEIDSEYMATETEMSREDTVNLIKSKLTKLSDMDVESQADRLHQKRVALDGLVFHWYHLIVIYLAGVVGWFMPEVSLLLRRYLVSYEEAEDVLQLQSLMITLSNTKMDVYKALYWLMLESTVHRAPLRYAYIEYPSDPELALRRLKDSVRSKDLKRLVSKLEKAVYDLSLHDAFRDIALDKQQSLIINEMMQTETIKSKKEFARLFAQAPAAITLIGGLVLPILILAFKQLFSAFNSM